MYENTREKEKVILIAVDSGEYEEGSYSVGDSLDELGELAKTAGAEIVGRMIQKLPASHPASYLGSGKIK